MSIINILNNKKTIHELRESLREYDKETLLDTVAYLVDTYIIRNDAININSPVTENSNTGTKYLSFCQLLKELQNEYSFPELDYFEITDNTVSININNQKIELNSQKQEKAADKAPEKTDSKEMSSETFKRFSNLELE